MTAYSKDIATHFGWTVGSDASLAWDSFATWRTANMVAGDSVTLTGPAATYIFARSGGGSSPVLASGMLGGITIIHNFPGSTFTDNDTGSGIFLSGAGLADDNLHSSRINTVLAGHNTITLKTSGEISRFPVGRYVVVTGCDLQGFGSPINPAFFDILKITSISSATITLDGPITHDLLDSWPVYNPGAVSGPNALDCGGPATVYILPAEFDVTAYFNGMTFHQGGGQIYARGKYVQLTDTICTSIAGIVPSVSKRQIYINHTKTVGGSQIELDKLIEDLTYLRCNLHSFYVQSPSCAKRLAFIDSAVDNLNGTPQTLLLLRSTIGVSGGGMNVGCVGYGGTELIRADNCVLPDVVRTSIGWTDIVGTEAMTMASGVIRWNTAVHAGMAWSVPGLYARIAGTGAHAPLDFRVVNVVDEGSGVIAVHTTATGGFPATDSTLTLSVHACPVHVGTGNTGAGAVAVDWDATEGDPLFFPLSAPMYAVEFGGSGGGGGGGALQRANIFSPETAIDPMQYYVPGNEAPAVSTADMLNTDGAYWLRPYDLLAWGSPGAAIAAARGARYFWCFSGDHDAWPSGLGSSSSNFCGAYTDDPGVFPRTREILFPACRVTTWSAVVPGSGFSGPAQCLTYEDPFVVYNANDPDGMYFYLYAEGGCVSPDDHTAEGNYGHQGMVWRSPDLTPGSWVPHGVSHPAIVSNGWGSFQRPVKLGPSSWISQGIGGVQTSDNFKGWAGISKWTSTDGLNFTLDGDGTGGLVGSAALKEYRYTDGTTYTFDEMRDAYLGLTQANISRFGFSASDDFIMGGVRYRACGETAGYGDPGSAGLLAWPLYVSLVPIDSSGNVQGTPAPIRIHGPFDGLYPAPGYLEAVNTCTSEGVLHVCVAHGQSTQVNSNDPGFPFASVQWNTSPSLGNGSTTTFTGTIGLLPARPHCVSIAVTYNGEVDGRDDGAGNIVGPNISSGTVNYTTGAVSVTFITAPANGAQMAGRSIQNAATIGDFNAATGYYAHTASGLGPGGGLCEQFFDYLTYIVDTTAAAQAAPIGVTASCSAGVVTLSWYDALPANTYRVKRYATSDTSGSGTAVGDVAGVSITDSPTAGSRYWYKVITLESGTERGSRVVHCYASAASTLINDHFNRVIDDGGDPTTINVTYLTAVETFLNSFGKTTLRHWADPRCGRKMSGSVVVKVYDFGTTVRPMGGDLTMASTDTSYAATGIDGTLPAWVNANTAAHAYFGGAYYRNQIRRQREITIAGLYQRTTTGTDLALLGTSTGSTGLPNYGGTAVSGISLVHASGTPGTVTLSIRDQAGVKTASVTASTNTATVAVGTYNGTQMVAYSDGTAGTANTALNPNPFFLDNTALAGTRGSTPFDLPLLASGTKDAVQVQGSTEVTPPFTPGALSFGQNNAQGKLGSLVVLAKGATSSQVTALTTLLKTP